MHDHDNEWSCRRVERYSDAAVEPSKTVQGNYDVSIGGVLLWFDEASKELRLIDAYMSESASYSAHELANSLTGIQALEAKAMAVAWKTFAERHSIGDHQMIDFRIDNLADVYAVVKTTGGAPNATQYLDVIRYLNRTCNWSLNYVASKRNIADWCTRSALKQVSSSSDPLLQELKHTIRVLRWEETDEIMKKMIAEIPERTPFTKKTNEETDDDESELRIELQRHFEMLYKRASPNDNPQ
ncbi:MAG: hypothetical protein CL798_01445 [Chromatiales bacterium]|nr:hypothetical protein [Chromatiales bacterium]